MDKPCYNQEIILISKEIFLMSTACDCLTDFCIKNLDMLNTLNIYINFYFKLFLRGGGRVLGNRFTKFYFKIEITYTLDSCFI